MVGPGWWVVIHSVHPPLPSASPLPPAFIFGRWPEHSCVIAAARCTGCTEDTDRQVHTCLQAYEYLMDTPLPHAHTNTHTHTILPLPIFSRSHYFPIPLQQKDEVSSQLEVTPVDWTNGPEQAARTPRYHSSYKQLSKMQNKHKCPSLCISTSNSLQGPVRLLYLTASFIPLNTEIALGTFFWYTPKLTVKHYVIG